MSASLLLAIATGAGLVAILVLAGRGRGPPAAWAAAFAGVLLVWTTADAAHAATGTALWHWVDVSTSPLTMPIGLHFAATFAGRARDLRRPLAFAWLWFGALALASATALVGEPLVAVGPWTVGFLVGIGWSAALATAILVGALRAAPNADERARARLLLLALPFAALFGATDLVETFVPGTPELAPLGVLGSALAMGVVALRWRLFGRDLSTTAGLQALGIGGTGVAAYLIVAELLASSAAALLLALTSVTTAVIVATRHVTREAAERRSREVELVHLGRAAAQMAHDMKNPLAAIRGAADVMSEELRRGADTWSVVELRELADGIRADADRLARLVDDYQRFVRVEPQPAAIDLAALARTASTSARRGAPSSITLEETSRGAVPAHADAALVEQVVDNLIRNAIEALGDRPGHVWIGATTAARASEEGALVRVEDDGPGMDARTRERAQDDFFTTKATGSGLGLAFARRVASAHGGSLELSARAGGGTIAELWLPARTGPSPAAGPARARG